LLRRGWLSLPSLMLRPRPPIGSYEINREMGAIDAGMDENAAFKAEVERMVQNSLGSPADTASAPLAPAVAKGEAEAEAKPVVRTAYTDAWSLLEAAGLGSRYLEAFEEEQVDPPTLKLVVEQQGREALDDALKELGVRSLGHRLKLVATLLGAD